MEILAVRECYGIVMARLIPDSREASFLVLDCVRISYLSIIAIALHLTSYQFIQAVTKILNIPWPTLCCETKNGQVNPKMSLNVLAALDIIQYTPQPISELLGKI
jgi:hypothetical protein